MIYFFIKFLKEQTLIRLISFISLIGFTTLLFSQGDITLIDDSENSKLVQKDIKGCVDSSVIKKQKRQIRELRRELKIILKRLSKMEKEISYSPLRGKYIVVRVKRGDTLSKYAKRFYGDERKYYIIYRANRGKIGKNLRLRVGDKILIPILKRGGVKQTLKKYKKYDYGSNYYIPTLNSSKNSIYSQVDSEKKLRMLDETVYIDDNSPSQKEVVFIPLDEN